MMRRTLVVAALMLLAPLPLLAQGGGGRMGAQGGQGMGMMGGLMQIRGIVEQSSVDFLIGKAETLKLNAEQTGHLKHISASYAEATKASREQLASLPQLGGGAAAGGDRQALMQRMQQLVPHVEKVLEEDQKAVQAAMALFSAEQKPAAEKLLEERRQASMPRRGGG
jgi:hypothetical protein